MTSKLELRGVAFRYGTTVALSQIDLAVDAGEFVSLLGPSGCGKTTILRIIAGLLRPEAGTVHVDGRDISGLPPERRPLSMVFQHLALFPHLSVADNVAFSLSLRRIARPEIKERVEAMLALVGLAGFGKRSIHQLSGGQQQRVALARSLIGEPEILLLDEPLGALDLQIRKEMQLELKSLQRRLGITFLFVTHDQTEAMAMSDRVVLMRQGRIVQDASPYVTYTEPKSPFAARFVGEANLLEGTVAVGADGAATVRVAGATLVLHAGLGFRDGEPVAVSVRPEHLALVAQSVGSTLEGSIVATSFLGHETLYRVATDAGDLLVRRPVADDGSGPEIGAKVVVAYDPARLRLYRLADRET